MNSSISRCFSRSGSPRVALAANTRSRSIPSPHSRQTDPSGNSTNLKSVLVISYSVPGAARLGWSLGFKSRVSPAPIRRWRWRRWLLLEESENLRWQARRRCLPGQLRRLRRGLLCVSYRPPIRPGRGPLLFLNCSSSHDGGAVRPRMILDAHPIKLAPDRRAVLLAG